MREPFTLVLDGYDGRRRDLAADLEFVLRHSGQRLRLVMLTRVDPVLPLHRFRLEDVDGRAPDGGPRVHRGGDADSSSTGAGST